MKKIITFLFIITTQISNSQNKQIANIEQYINENFTNNQNDKFTFRLYAVGSLSNQRQLLLIKKDINEKWSIRSVLFKESFEKNKFSIRNDIDILVERDWTERLYLMLSSNRNLLFDQESVLNKLRSNNEGRKANWQVMDGTNYEIEIYFESERHNINLNSPCGYLEGYPESNELKLFCAVIKLISDYEVLEV
jgi:hypothetical protein